MCYTFSLLNIIIVKFLIDLFDLGYLILIDWILLRLSIRCVRKFLNNLLLSQASRKLVLYYIILKKYWIHFAKNYKKNQCLFLLHHLPFRKPPRVHGLHFIILPTYAIMPPIYVIFSAFLSKPAGLFYVIFNIIFAFYATAGDQIMG